MGFWCPCKNCFNTKKYYRDVIFNHCGCDGIIQNYTKWVWHGEATKNRPMSHTVEDYEVMNDTL